MSDLSQHPLAQPVEPLKKATPNGQEKSGKKDSSKATTSEAPPLVAATCPDPTQPIELSMVRSGTMSLNQDNGAKALALGQYVANGGNIDGAVQSIWQYPNGTILIGVLKRIRIGEKSEAITSYMTLVGEFEGEVLTESVRENLKRRGKL